MPATRNLCAQLPLDLHQRVCEAREESGLTTAQYITNLLLEYYEMKENGGNAAMTNGKNRTLAFQIDEELFQRIKAHLERESARLGRKVTQAVLEHDPRYPRRTADHGFRRCPLSREGRQ